MARIPPPDGRALLGYVNHFFKVRLPSRPVCEGHSTPYHFLHALYFRRSTDGTPTPSPLGVAHRGGMKTLTLAIDEVMETIHYGADLIHAASIEAQAKKCKEYVDGFAELPFIAEYIYDLRTKAYRTTTGGRYQIVWATIKQLNSPHAPILRIDELDLFPRDLFDQALGMLSSDPRVSSSIGYISSLKSAYGLTAEKMNDRSVQPFVWCYIENTERCPDSRSGTVPVLAYIDVDRLDAVSETQYLNLRPEEQESYEPFRVYEGCFECPLLATCRGRLKKSDGHDRIDDLIVKYERASPTWWIFEMESRMAKPRGVVFPEFSERIHVVRRRYEPSHEDPIYVFLDPGRHRPYVGLAQHERRGDVLHCFDEFHVYGEDLDIPLERLSYRMEDLLFQYGIPKSAVIVICDVAGNQMRDVGQSTISWLRRQGGWRVRSYRMYVMEGIEAISARLKRVNGQPRLKFYVYDNGKRGAVGLVRAMKECVWAVDPYTKAQLDHYPKDNRAEHAIDALRYLCVGVERKRFSRGDDPFSFDVGRPPGANPHRF